MDGMRQRLCLVGLMTLAVTLTAGCTLSSLPYFLSGDDPKQMPGEMGFNAPDKKKPAKVAIFVYSGLETRPEFVTVDRDLSAGLIRILQQRCPENHQFVRFIPPSKIEEFKNTHSDWHAMPLKELGKRFDADYVIYLEIESLSLYEKGSSNQLYRGRTSIAVTCVDLRRPDEDPLEKQFPCEYPAARGPIAVDDQNPREFYLAFIKYVCKHLSWYFTAYPPEEGLCE
jgi:hypothetical protein